MSIRLVATDLDGTLLRDDGSVSARTREALLAAEAAGLTVVFVTGRPLRWSREVFAHVGAHGLAIVSNGALLWNVATDEPSLVRPIADDVLLRACVELRAAVPGTTYAVETLLGIGLEPGFMERYPVPDGASRAPLEDLLQAPVVKLLARHEDQDPMEFWKAADEVWQGRLTTTWSSSSTLLEVSAPGVTKATTLELLCDGLGIGAAEVLALGDMPNDLPLLRWAGAGCAVGNAHPLVLEAADRVVATNEEDGVAQVIEALLG